MGKMKESLYTENTDVAQVPEVGDVVFVYDSKFGLEPELATVLYSKSVGEEIVLSVETQGGALMQVSEIQCRRAAKKLKRKIWIKYQDGTTFSRSKPPEDGEQGWIKFVEEFE